MSAPSEQDAAPSHHEYTRRIVCPHCGFQMDDPEFYLQEGGIAQEWECGACERPFEAWVAVVKVLYSTRTPEESDGNP